MGNRGRVGCVGLVALAAVLSSAFARAGEAIERFLPPETFLYGGVEKLGGAFDKVTGLLRRALPFLAENLSEQRILKQLGDGLFLGDVRTRDQLAAATGLDPNGSAGIAWVVADPSGEPFRDFNEYVLLILPLKDGSRAEAWLAERMLREFASISEGICQQTISRIREARQRWQQRNPGGANQPVTWQELATANPGLKPLLCPAGGEYRLGGPNEPPTCSLHAAGFQRPQGPFTRATLGEKKLGDITLVGGRNKGTGYAITDTHLILSTHMNVLEGAVAAAAGTGPRAAIPPRGTAATNADGRGYIHMGRLLWEVRREVARASDRRPSQAAQRLLALLDGLGGATLDLALTDSIAGGVSWEIARNEGTQAFLDVPPSKLESLALVPDTALLAVGANLAQPVAGVIGDFVASRGGDAPVGLVLKLIQPVCEGDGAFAMTKGIFAREMPNFLLILKVREPEMAKTVAEALALFVAQQMRAEGGPERTDVGGVPVWTFKSRGEVDMALHYAFAGPFFVGGTSLDDLKAAVELQAGRAQNSLLAGARYRKLELPEGPASIVSFVDMPALIGQFEEAARVRRQFWMNESCRQNLQRTQALVTQFRAERGNLPATFGELKEFASDPKRRQTVMDFCMPAGPQTKLTLDPATGKATCPQHGTTDNFMLVVPDAPRRRSMDEIIVSAFGVWGVRLRMEGGRLVGEGRLIPAPQQAPARPPGTTF